MASVISTIVSSIKSISNQLVTVVTKYDPIKEASTFNFRGSSGTPLAGFQDNIIQMIQQRQVVSENQIKQLENDLWIPVAERLAPCNLVIRQLCLIDILRNNIKNQTRILNLVDKISYKADVSGVRIWAEGYSYFEYCMIPVQMWLAKFASAYPVQTTQVRTLMLKIYNGFIKTAYKRGNVWYPAPFGDLYDIPLGASWQQAHTPANFTIANVKMNVTGGVVTSYNITSRPLGLNMHTVAKSYNSNIVSGQPTNFTYYQGYDKKYPNTSAEISDMMNPARLITLATL